MLEPAIRKDVTNACSYKLLLLSEVFGCRFALRTMRLFPFLDPAHKCLYSHVYLHMYMYIDIYVHLCMHVCTL